MPINPNAAIEITAFQWVPEFAQGLVRDLRVRWALEEAGLDYRVRLLGQQRPADYIKEQPFDQVPCFSDGTVQIFESGAIVQYIGEKCEALLPRDPQGKYQGDPVDFRRAEQRRAGDPAPSARSTRLLRRRRNGRSCADRAPTSSLELKLKRVSDWLGDKQWLEGDRFTIGDLIMVTVLRHRSSTRASCSPNSPTSPPM